MQVQISDLSPNNGVRKKQLLVSEGEGFKNRAFVEALLVAQQSVIALGLRPM